MMSAVKTEDSMPRSELRSDEFSVLLGNDIPAQLKIREAQDHDIYFPLSFFEPGH